MSNYTQVKNNIKPVHGIMDYNFSSGTDGQILVSTTNDNNNNIIKWNNIVSDKIAIGDNSGQTQGTNCIAIGNNAGQLQGNNSIAIGNSSGQIQGNNSIAIGSCIIGNTNITGTSTGTTNQLNNTIILSSNPDANVIQIDDPNNLNEYNSTYISSIRQNLPTSSILHYDDNYEITYGSIDNIEICESKTIIINNISTQKVNTGRFFIGTNNEVRVIIKESNVPISYKDLKVSE